MKKILRALRENVPEIVIITGMVIMTIGVAMLSKPFAFVAGGLWIAIVGVILTKS
ncbi:MAG: hypothetical protein RSD74_02105 [Angelakisella sp.]